MTEQDDMERFARAGYDECKVPIPDYPRPEGCSNVAELFFEAVNILTAK